MLTVYQHFITTWQPNVKYFCNSSQYSTWSFSPHGSTSSRRRTTFFAHQKLFWCINTTHQCSYTHPIFATAWVLSFPVRRYCLERWISSSNLGGRNKESWLLVRHKTYGCTSDVIWFFTMYNFWLRDTELVCRWFFVCFCLGILPAKSMGLEKKYLPLCVIGHPYLHS